MPIEPGQGLGAPLTNAGAPSNGTSEVQTLSITGSPTGGTFTLTFQGFATAAIAYNASAATVIAALEALPTIGAGGVTGSGGALPGTPVAITFAAQMGVMAVPLITADSAGLTGGSSPAASVAETTPGVTATHRGAVKGAQLIDTTNAKLYSNTGTAAAPTWTVTGTQS